MTVTIAIDPGKSGGIAVDYGQMPKGSVANSIEACGMPDTPRDIFDVLTAAKELAEMNECQVRCVMEQVGGYVSGGGQPGSAMFTFGRNFGLLEGFLVALGISFELVTPQKWQKAVGLIFPPVHRGVYPANMDRKARAAEKKRVTAMNGQRKRDNKKKMKEMAQRIFPSVKVTLETSDALLLILYARKQQPATT